jgi:hypothetical protein
MNCREFEENLDLLAGAPGLPVSPDLSRWAMEHSGVCSRCRRLLAIARGEAEDVAEGETDSDALTRAVLHRTSGSPCRAATLCLCDWIDGALQGPEAELLTGHLHRCPECRGIESTLRELALDLPALAEVRPDPYFVRDVLLATSRRSRATVPLGRTLKARWSSLLRRPRIAQELAYACALIVFFVFGPIAPEVSEQPWRMATAIRANPLADTREILRRNGVRLDAVENLARDYRSVRDQVLTVQARSVWQRADRSARAVWQTIQIAFRGLDESWPAVWKRDFLGACRTLDHTVRAIQRCWETPSPSKPENDGTEPAPPGARSEVTETNPRPE